MVATRPVGFLIATSIDWMVVRASENIGKFIGWYRSDIISIPLAEIRPADLHDLRDRMALIRSDAHSAGDSERGTHPAAAALVNASLLTCRLAARRRGSTTGGFSTASPGYGVETAWRDLPGEPGPYVHVRQPAIIMIDAQCFWKPRSRWPCCRYPASMKSCLGLPTSILRPRQRSEWNNTAGSVIGRSIHRGEKA